MIVRGRILPMSREFTSGNQPEQNGEGIRKSMSRGDLIRRRLAAEGKDWDAMRQRQRDKVMYGCVIRSFESALGVDATDAEVDMRLAQVKEGKTIADILYETRDDPPGSADKVAKLEIIKDNERIQTLLSQLSEHDTPLGEALRESMYEQQLLPVKEIKQKIRAGEKVCLIGNIADHRIHMTHLELDAEGTLISKSDNNTAMALKEDDSFPSIIFTPKSKE